MEVFEFIEIGKINKQYLPGSRLRVKTKTGEVNAFVVGTEKKWLSILERIQKKKH